MCTGGASFERGAATRGMGLGMQGLGAGAQLTFAFAADPHVPAAVLDVDPAVHVPLHLVVVVNQAAIQVEDEPVPLPAAQDGAWWDREQVKEPSEPSGMRPVRSQSHPPRSDPACEPLHPIGHLCLAQASEAA